MPESGELAKRFEENRGRLRTVAYRILGSFDEADDAVQEAWLRLSRSDSAVIENLTGWLTTVTARICLDLLRARKPRLEMVEMDASAPSPEREALLADSVGLALMSVLDRLTPPERVAFVLHDVFDLSFEEIAPIVGRNAAATRQLASRGRRRVRGVGEAPAGRERQRKLVAAFQAASRSGDLRALMAVLDPEAVLRCDAAAVSAAAAVPAAPRLAPEIRGAQAIAETFLGRAAGAIPVLIEGVPGLAWAPGGTVRAAFAFGFAGGAIAGIEIVADTERLARMAIVIAKAGTGGS